MNGRRRLMGSFWHGSIANAMPQAFGAQAAFSERQVVSLSGDSGFTMLMGDLLSAKPSSIGMSAEWLLRLSPQTNVICTGANAKSVLWQTDKPS
jgi:hypothetical protein